MNPTTADLNRLIQRTNRNLTLLDEMIREGDTKEHFQHCAG